MSRPLHATEHCRHFSYHAMDVDSSSGGPICAAGVDLTEPGACRVCMPSSNGACDKRENFTRKEKNDWQQWVDSRADRDWQIMLLIPGSSNYKTRERWGSSGEFDCPACKTGRVSWYRSEINGHVQAGCSTPDCFGVIE